MLEASSNNSQFEENPQICTHISSRRLFRENIDSVQPFFKF